MPAKFYNTVYKPLQRVRGSHITYMTVDSYPDVSTTTTRTSNGYPLRFNVTAIAHGERFTLASGLKTEKEAEEWIKKNWK